MSLAKVLRFVALMSVCIALTNCRTGGDQADESGAEVKAITIASGASTKQVFYAATTLVHYWSCGAEGPAPGERITVERMNGRCQGHKSMQRVDFKRSLTSAYLAKVNRTDLTANDKESMKYLFMWLSQRWSAGWHRDQLDQSDQPFQIMVSLLPQVMGITAMSDAGEGICALERGRVCAGMPREQTCRARLKATGEVAVTQSQGGWCGARNHLIVNDLCDKGLDPENYEIRCQNEGGAPISGHDFNGERTCEALPPGSACPLLADRATDACNAANGDLSFCADCSVLCSKAISGLPTDVGDAAPAAACAEIPSICTQQIEVFGGCEARPTADAAVVAYFEQSRANDNKCKAKVRLLKRICANGLLPQGDDPAKYTIDCP